MSGSVCDICARSLEPGCGYYLATWAVVVSEAFWRYHYARLKKLYGPRAGDEGQQMTVFSGGISRAAGSVTPWLVCEECSEFFVFDRTRARACAIAGEAPQGNGPVRPDGCTLTAAAAWEHVYGYWPASVEQPRVTGSCDLCDKKMHAGEMAGSVSLTQMQSLRAAGIITEPVLSPPRPDSGTWIICAICLVAILSRQQRLG
jgi:hypothetical protein